MLLALLLIPESAIAEPEGAKPPSWAYTLQDHNPYESGPPVEAPKTVPTPVQVPDKPKVASAPSGSVLSRIAACESNGDLYARNPKSTAKGKYQFLDGSWKYYGKQLWGSEWVNKNVFSEKDQDELANYVVSINGYRDWNASRYCWG